ncbi:MAG: response regulator [Lachnospiraceae bacterium]|nr:response regulator [Lachnospiraceae bacterium]
MDYDDILNSRFAEPAAVLNYQDGAFSLIGINEGFLPEMWMNVSKEAYLKTDPRTSFDEENYKAFSKAVRECIETGEEQTVEIWRQMSSDCCGEEKICLRCRLVLLEKTPGGAVIYEGVRNISNEKRAQHTLEDIEYRYQQASEQINIYNWEYIIATKEMRPCYRCMRDLGLPAVVKNYPEPAIDMGIFPPDYADMYRDMMRRVDAGEAELEADIPLTVGRIPFRVKYTTEFDSEGHPVKAFGSATLISETELGKIKLDNQIIASLAGNYHGIYLADFVSDTVKIVKQDQIFAFKEGTDCRELVAGLAEKLTDLTAEQKEKLRDVGRLRAVFFKDSDLREFSYKDELSDQWIRIGYHVLERSYGKIDRLMVSITVLDDLQAQKMDADRLIASQKEELEKKQGLLLEAIEEANRANEAKTAFFSNMSHDIRTPMNSIIGFSKLALEEIDNREHLEDYLHKIFVSGNHLMSLINDILDMSRIESGKMELSASPYVLKELLKGCADMVQIKMEEKKLHFDVQISEMGEDVVECDKLRFNQVLLNILSNAYKYTPEGGSVFLTGKLTDRADKLTYEIRVRDTGIGMSEEFRKRIWDAYAREDTASVHEAQGTGLGMVIVRNIVNMMQGTIEVVSEPGKGSEFIVALPMKPTSIQQTEEAKDMMKEAAMNRDYSDVTVLVVDDTPINLTLAKSMLKKFNFQILSTDSGIKAVELVKNAKPGDIDLILMDVMMPVMNGYEATKQIRSLPDPVLSNLPIIAMTANAFETDIQKAHEAGMDSHISKPYTKEGLVTTIYEHLQKNDR